MGFNSAFKGLKNRRIERRNENSGRISEEKSMANICQRNKQNFIYRNECAKEINKKIKDRKNKK